VRLESPDLRHPTSWLDNDCLATPQLSARQRARSPPCRCRAR
jgi:hypothetical protein